MSAKKSLNWRALSLISGAAVSALLLWNTRAAADTETVIRSQMPNGSVTYSDRPAAGAASMQRLDVEPHPADPLAAAKASRELEVNRQRMAAEIASHEERRLQLDEEIRSTLAKLEQARALRERGRVIGDGDRQGRRFTADYWARQVALDERVRREISELERLRLERRALDH